MTLLHDAEKQAAIRQTWNLEETPEVPFLIEIGAPHFGTSDYYDDDEAELAWNVRYHQERAEVYDYGMPNVKPNIGISVMAAAFGCEYTVNNEADPWVTPLIREANAADVYQLKKPDLDHNPIYQKVLERIDYIQAHTALPLRLVNVPSPLVTASLIWEYTPFIEATILHPEKVHALLEIVTEATIEYVQLQLNHITNLHTMGHEMWYIPRDVGVRISDDTAALLSPKAYREFGVRYNAKISEAFGGIVIHSCGDLRHVLPVMLETPGVRGLDITIPQNSKWDVVKQAVGKTALNLRHFYWDHEQTGIDLAEYTRTLIETFGRRGIFIQTSAPSVPEAVAIGQQLHRILS